MRFTTCGSRAADTAFEEDDRPWVESNPCGMPIRGQPGEPAGVPPAGKKWTGQLWRAPRSDSTAPPSRVSSCTPAVRGGRP
jgi:hypothetical protein